MNVDNIFGLFIFLDFEKVFDFLEWNFIVNILEFFGFGLLFIYWFIILYMDILFIVLNNGFFIDFFKISRGVC